MLSLVVLSIRKVFLWLQQQGRQTILIYKASATVLTIVNIITLGLDLSFSAETYDWFVQVTILLPSKVLLLLFLELPVICCRTYELNQNGRKWYRPLHAFALWQIICFIHRLIIDIIISLVFFILAPAQTVGVVTLLLSVIASAIASVAIIINKGCAGCPESYDSIWCAVFNGILVTGLLLVMTLLFIVFVDNGLQSAGAGGLILSLIPPLLVFGIGIFVKKNSVRSSIISTFLGGTQNSSISNNDGDPGDEDKETQPLLERRP